MTLHWIDVSVLVGYLALVVVMGIYFSRENKNTEEYFVGGRSFSGWIIGLSLVGTSISSVTFLAYPADAFKTSWIRYVPNFALPLGIYIAAYFFLPFSAVAGLLLLMNPWKIGLVLLFAYMAG